jgi:hypothetical protein
MTEIQYLHCKERVEAAREEFKRKYGHLDKEVQAAIWPKFLKLKFRGAAKV